MTFQREIDRDNRRDKIRTIAGIVIPLVIVVGLAVWLGYLVLGAIPVPMTVVLPR